MILIVHTRHGYQPTSKVIAKLPSPAITEKSIVSNKDDIVPTVTCLHAVGADRIVRRTAGPTSVHMRENKIVRGR